MPIAVDPPEHTRFRRLLGPFFSPRRMALIEPELRKQAGALIDAIAEKGSCELNEALAIPYPTQVFLTLFGLPLEDRDRLVEWKDVILAFVNPTNAEAPPELIEKALELFTYLSEHIKDRTGGEGEDLLTQLLANKDEDGMTEEEILGLCFLFVLAGLDTVTSSLGFAFHTLARDPELRARLMAEPDQWPTFIEENLRVEGPVPFVSRVTLKDVDVAGIHIPAGSSVLLSIGAASRDERRCEHADAYDLDRPRAPHFGFGRGPHRCLGSHLGRMELRIVLEEWHKRIPNYELAPGAQPSVPWPAGSLNLDTIELVVTD